MWNRRDDQYLVLNDRRLPNGDPLPYRDEARIITALKVSGELQHLGLTYKEIDIVNVNGVTLEAMKNHPVQAGFALRHRTEKWYWNSPFTQRVWYPRPGDIQGQWLKIEAIYAVEEDRDERRDPTVQKLEMVRGFSDGRVQNMPNWFA
jgi:hypothetical protein